MPTQGSCLPFTEIFVFLPFLSIVSLLDNIEEVGFTENEATTSCPEEIPPNIPPALLDLKFRSMILPDIFIDQDSPENMYKKAGLDSLSIVNKVEDVLKSNIVLAQNKSKNLN